MNQIKKWKLQRKNKQNIKRVLICNINQVKIHKIMRIIAFTQIKKCQSKIKDQLTDVIK